MDLQIESGTIIVFVRSELEKKFIDNQELRKVELQTTFKAEIIEIGD